jgi:hypothetical protein
MTGWSRTGVPFYDGHGTAKQWIKEGKCAVKWTRLSCHNFKNNEVRLQLLAQRFGVPLPRVSRG